MKDIPALSIQGMARKFVRESIIEDAAARLVAQIMTEVADTHIAPRDAEINKLKSQLEEARAKAIEKAAQVAADAYTEYWRISNEHEVHWRAWRQSGEVGEMPTISLGPMSDFIASRIRALLSAPTEERGGG